MTRPPAARAEQPPGRTASTPGPVGRVWWRVLRAALGLLAVLLVLSAFAAGYVRHRDIQQFATQFPPPDIPLSAAELSAFQAAATTPPGVADAPIVITYHDITERPTNNNDVSREEFARHMAMLHAAGYRTLTGDEFVAFMRGADAPPRSVLITFDDGTQGLWTHADRILASYGFHAVSFVVTGQLDGVSGPYYLSWPEVKRMAASGRWTFGSHTRDSHRQVVVDPTGMLRSRLVNRQWTPSGRESMSDFQRRVDDDLQGSIADLIRHGLPRPRLFAYPFSEASFPAQDGDALRYVLGRVAQLFDTAFSSRSAVPEPAGVRARHRAPVIVDRLVVRRSTSAAQLFGAMQRMRTLPVDRARPLAKDAVWLTPDGRTAGVRTVGDRLTVDGLSRYVTAAYAAQATGDWTGYRVTATIRGLQQVAAVSGTLSARLGGSHPVHVRVSSRTVRVSLGSTEVVARLDPSDAHAVSIDAAHGRTVVTVDGVRRFDAPTADSPAARGGIGVAVLRASAAVRFPMFDAVTVSSLAPR